MIIVIVLLALGVGGGLAASSAVPRWVPWLVPLAVVPFGVHDVRRYEEGHLVLGVFIVIEILTVIAILAGYSFGDRERLYRGD
ncbi:MAG TPA: hypothetical protein VI318_01935 [Baekduia sp.]